jgi:hypothetical protein
MAGQPVVNECAPHCQSSLTPVNSASLKISDPWQSHMRVAMAPGGIICS